MDSLRAGGASGWVLHGIKSFKEGGVAEVSFAFVAVDAIKEGGNLKELEASVHEVEILDVFFIRHGDL